MFALPFYQHQASALRSRRVHCACSHNFGQSQMKAMTFTTDYRDLDNPLSIFCRFMVTFGK
ncbi:MAG: hypothetical protein AAFZ17_04030 [Cyanobacteria bacterium J06650_10]